MDRTEFRFRLQQEFDKRQDRFLAMLGYDFSSRVTLSTGRNPKFFLGVQAMGPSLDLLRNRLPETVEHILQQAEKILKHRFDLLGYSDLDYGESIAWHKDLVHNKRAPRNIFYRVPYLDFRKVGDSKVTWELNRHQHFVTLAKAYRLTNDKRFLDEIARQWRHWWMENPYPIGINWASSLELGFRSLSWLWTYHLLEGMSPVEISRDDWMRGLALHGQHIERYLSTYFSPNTHLLGEGVALFFLGVLCPELSSAERWKFLGWKIVLREAQRQVQADGFHFEQSTYYHVYALDFFLHAAILANLNGIAIPAELSDQLQKMLSALYLLGRAGSPPRLGDDDGGRLFDPSRNRSDYLIDPLAIGAVVFGRPEFKSAARKLTEETIWLCGPKGVEAWDELQTATAEPGSDCLPASGFYILNSRSPAAQLILDCGPLGTQSGGHGHADALSITLQCQGRDLLIDPGTCEYAGNAGDRDLFRGTSMHNTMSIDGLDQAQTVTAFSWKSLTKPKVEEWVQGHDFDMLVASHDGYHRLAEPVTHRRSVFSLRNGIYLVQDRAEVVGQHRLEVCWHLGPDLKLTKPGIFQNATGDPVGLAILDADASDWRKEMRPTFWSPAYGRKLPSTTLVYSTQTQTPSTICVLLVTLEKAVASPGSFIRLNHPEQDSSVSAYGFSRETEEHRFYLAKAGKSWQFGAISSDAEFVCFSKTGPNTAGKFILVNGSRARVGKNLELRCKRPVAWAEVTWRESQVEFHSSDPEALEQDLPAVRGDLVF